MEVAAGELERLQDADDLLDAGQQLEGVIFDRAVVADDADDRALGALGEVGLVAERLHLAHHVLDLGGRGVVLHDDDHLAISCSAVEAVASGAAG